MTKEQLHYMSVWVEQLAVEEVGEEFMILLELPTVQLLQAVEAMEIYIFNIVRKGNLWQ